MATYDFALDEIGIFKGITETERAAIAKRCSWQRVTAHQQLINYMDPTNDIFFVVEGQLRVINYSVLGKEVAFSEIGPGEIVGEFAPIDGGERSANVFALTDSFVGSMPADEFWQVIRQHPAVTAALLKHLTGIIRHLNGRIFEFSTLAVNNRIHAELLRLALAAGIKDNVSEISPVPTHAEIASRISTHREAVTREINALAQAGVLEKRNRALVVRDIAWLQDVVEMKLGATPNPPH